MMTSCTLISMGLYSSWLMGLCDSSSQDFLHTPQTTRKSEWLLYQNLDISIIFFRMLMTCLRYLALCPCPRCLLLKSRISLISSKTDHQQRFKLMRVDSHARRVKIELARRLLFEQGVNITSKRIDTLLQSQSLVPTRVSDL